MSRLLIFAFITFISKFLFSQAYPPDSIALRQIYEVWYDSPPCNNLVLSVSQWCHVQLDSMGRVACLSNQVPNQIAPNSYIHPAIGQLTKLEMIIIQQQYNLAGTIPIEIGNLINLEILEFQSTNLIGAIPSSINNMLNLKDIHISGIDSSQNRIDGILPPLNNLNKLEGFVLNITNIRGNIPGYFGYLDSLEDIQIISNPLFGGLLNDSLCHSQTIGQIHIGNCPMFHGKLPDCLGGIPTLSDLYIYKTNFTDTIPYSVCNPDTNLLGYFPNNRFTGMATMQPGTKAVFFDLRYNLIQFGSFEENLASLGTYFNIHIGDIHPQDSMWSPLDTTIGLGWNITLDSRVSGQYNRYWWYKDSVYLGWNTTGLWQITNATLADAGQYNCRIRNDYITPIKGLILERHHIRLHVDSTLVDVGTYTNSEPDVSPNPFNATLQVNLNKLAGNFTTITLYNSAGIPVFTCETRKYYRIIDTEKLPAGLYFLKLQQGDKVYTYKVVKE